MTNDERKKAKEEIRRAIGLAEYILIPSIHDCDAQIPSAVRQLVVAVQKLAEIVLDEEEKGA